MEKDDVIKENIKIIDENIKLAVQNLSIDPELRTKILRIVKDTVVFVGQQIQEKNIDQKDRNIATMNIIILLNELLTNEIKKGMVTKGIKPEVDIPGYE